MAKKKQELVKIMVRGKVLSCALVTRSKLISNLEIRNVDNEESKLLDTLKVGQKYYVEDKTGRFKAMITANKLALTASSANATLEIFEVKREGMRLRREKDRK